MRGDVNNRAWNVLGLLLFAGVIMAIFWEVLPWFLAFVAPDAMPFFPFGNRTVTLENLLATGGEFTPHHLYWLIFHPLLANKLTYIVDTLMLTLAGVYYLRGRGVSLPAAWVGGLALGFCGYTFTLFSAGHRGYFHMMGCAVFSFGLLLRCFHGRRWFHFAMLGACLVWGLPYQPDVLVFVGLLAAAFALWLTFARRADPATPPLQRIVRVWPRFFVSLAVAGAIAGPSIRDMVGAQIAGRKGQIASIRSPAANGDAAVKKHDQWIFATNWSLPPADMAEFIVPGIFGNDSFQPPYPYWGALGRPDGWEPGQRSMPNYRQHTLYLGVLPVCFALFAVLLWWRTRRCCEHRVAGQRSCNLAAFSLLWERHPVARKDSFPADGVDSALPLPDDPLADVPFWLGAGMVCLLLALGRYTPFYRIFYAIPYMDLVRCPVKFHHLVEICTAFLCGLGVEMWWRGAVVTAPAKNGTAMELPPAAMVGHRLIVLAAVLACALLITAGIVSASGTEIAAHIAQLGLGGYGERLAGYAVENLVRAACLFGVAALLFGVGRPRVGRGRPAVWLLAVLALVVAVDLATVAQRFMRPIDMQPFYTSHVVSDTAVARGGIGAGVANYATGNDSSHDWFASSLSEQGLRLSLAPPASGSREAAVLQALAKRPEVLWRATHARFVIAPWKAAAPLVKSQVLEPLVSFALGQGNVQQAQPSMETDVLAAFGGALPAAYVVDGWQGGLNETAQVQRIGAADWDPAQTTLCDAAVSTNGMSRIIGQAQVIRRRGVDFCLTTTVAVNTPQPGLLILDENYADALAAHVDAQVVPVHRANALWVAVEVPAGRHRVTVRRCLHAGPFLVSALAGALVILWGLLRLWQHGVMPRLGMSQHNFFQ